MLRHCFIVCAVAAILLCMQPALAASSDAANALPLIPYPKSVQVRPGTFTLEPNAKIAATSPSLTPLAEILSQEIYLTQGLRLDITQGPGEAGDIVLRVDPSLRAGKPFLTVQHQHITKTRDGAYTLTVGDRVIVAGFDYRAAAEGTSTLLQLLNDHNGTITLPHVDIKDWPQSDYDAIMVDVGRQEIPIPALKQAVEACRFYRVRYMQLHLNDNQGWTFPSKAYPKLGTHNHAAHDGIAPKIYSLQDLKDLVAFADARGVTLVPEMETVGHTGAMRRAMPKLFDLPNSKGHAQLGVMNMANPNIYPALDTLTGEICNVFKSSPYFHIGCDEANLSVLRKQPQVKAYMRAHGIKDVYQLFLQHVRKMNKIVRAHGRMTILWQGAAVDQAMSKNVLVETWSGGSNYASKLQKEGFTTITVPWNLAGIPWDHWTIYDSNGSRLSRNDRVLGAMLVMWEMSGPALVNEYLLGTTGGHLTAGHGLDIPGIPRRQMGVWGPDHVINIKRFDKHDVRNRARLKRIVQPVTLSVDGLDLSKQNRSVRSGKGIFYHTLSVTMTGPKGIAGAIHYTTDNSKPTMNSPIYHGKLSLNKTTMVKASFFTPTGQRLGYISQGLWRHIIYNHNLATDKPVTTDGGTQGDQKPALAVDGRLNTAWWASPYPKWLEVDLGRTFDIGSIQLFPYWDGSRSYQYTISVSTDGQHWRQVVDESRNKKRSTSKGRMFQIKGGVEARYVRVDMLHDTANNAVHIKELRVFPLKAQPSP